MIDPVDIHLANQIRRLRIAARLTTTDLGKAIGVSFQQVQKYESGVNRVSGSRLYSIARCLRVAPGAFFEGLPQDSGNITLLKSDKRIEYCSTAEGMEMVDDLLALPKRLRTRIVSLVFALADELADPLICPGEGRTQR